jgi:hypothetical protein
MIKSFGIDLAGTGEYKVWCLDEEGQLCDGFGFDSTPERLAKLCLFYERYMLSASERSGIVYSYSLTYLT